MENRKPKVILLVAGEGTRLRPYTLDRPKCMVEINGISLIDRQLSVLESEGLNDILMIGGYKAEMLRNRCTRLKLNSRYHETNMVWTLFSAEEELEGDIILSYGDIVYSKKILQALLKSTEDIAVIIDKGWESYWLSRSDNPMDDAETLKLRANGTIYEIGKKPKSLNDMDGQYIGLMKFTAKGIEKLKAVFHSARSNGNIQGKSVESSYMTDLLQELIDADERIMAIPVYGDWVEIDVESDLHSDVCLSRVERIEDAVKLKK
jgi:choline kinase